MTELKDLKVAVEASAETVKREPKKDALGRSYATGKRKDAVARVWLKMGKGNIVVNGRDVKDYFGRPVLQMIINQPFVATAREGLVVAYLVKLVQFVMVSAVAWIYSNQNYIKFYVKVAS